MVGLECNLNGSCPPNETKLKIWLGTMKEKTMKRIGALIAEVVTLALMRHIQKADGSISGYLGLRTV